MRKRRLIGLMRRPLGRAVLAPMLRLHVQRWRIRPETWGDRPPLRIGVISDLHWGFAPISAARVAQVKRRLAAMSPDLIVFLGDLPGGFGRAAIANVQKGAEALAGLDAPLGVFAILGNHDWHRDPAAQARRDRPVAATSHLEKAGFQVLQNRATRLRKDLWLAGLDSQQAIKGRRFRESSRIGREDLQGTLAQMPGDDPVILLAHEPDIFADLAGDRVVLMLSGHTHAGQVRLFGHPLYVPSRHGRRYAYGHFQDGPRHLVVSAGLGATRVPLRVGTIPEITLIELG